MLSDADKFCMVDQETDTVFLRILIAELPPHLFDSTDPVWSGFSLYYDAGVNCVPGLSMAPMA